MPVAFLTSLTEEEFKVFLKQAITEVLADHTNARSTVPELLDIRQAADFLKLKVPTLYEKTSQRIIPHIKKGNKLYFDRADLTEWLKGGKIKTQKEIENDAINFLAARKSRRNQ